MLEKLGFQAVVEETITCERKTQVMSPYKFVLGIVLGLYKASISSALWRTKAHRIEWQDSGELVDKVY